MIRRDSTLALSDWQDAPAAFLRQVRSAKAVAPRRLEVGQRFHRIGLPSVVWRVSRVYLDKQSVEHAVLACNRRDLDFKTLSAVVLLDSRQYRSV